MVKNAFKAKSTLLFVAIAAQFLTVDALATQNIQNQAIGLQVIPNPTTVPDRRCLACHTVGYVGGVEKADKTNLKPGYQAAWKADQTKLTKLKTLLNVLPTTTVGLAGSGLAKTDKYEVICTTGAATLTSSVRDLAPPNMLAKVTTQVKKGAAGSPVATDLVDGDAAYSAPVTLAGGVGVYTVNVTKTAYTGTVANQKGPESYTGQLACKTAAGALTGLAWRIIQNQ